MSTERVSRELAVASPHQIPKDRHPPQPFVIQTAQSTYTPRVQIPTRRTRANSRSTSPTAKAAPRERPDPNLDPGGPPACRRMLHTKRKRGVCNSAVRAWRFAGAPDIPLRGGLSLLPLRTVSGRKQKKFFPVMQPRHVSPRPGPSIGARHVSAWEGDPTCVYRSSH